MNKYDHQQILRYNEYINKEKQNIKDAEYSIKDFERERQALIEKILGVNIEKTLDAYYALVKSCHANKTNSFYLCDRYNVVIKDSSNISARFIILDEDVEKCQPTETLLQIYKYLELAPPFIEKYEET